MVHSANEYKQIRDYKEGGAGGGSQKEELRPRKAIFSSLTAQDNIRMILRDENLEKDSAHKRSLLLSTLPAQFR